MPHGSVAVQVRLTEYACGQEPGVVSSANVKVTVPPQASVAVGVAKEGVAGHSMVLGSGNWVMTGAVLSSTVMVWLAVLVLPQGSFAVQVRFTEYFCGQEPGVVSSAKVKVTVPPQASVAVGVAKEGVAGHSMVEGAGSDLMTGAVLSSTVMIWLAVLVLPQGLVAVQVRFTEYFCGQEPCVVTSAKVRATVPPQPSVAVGVAKEGVEGHSMVVGAGSELITGAVVSSTVMVWLAVLVLPQGSFAVQVRVTEYFCGQELGVVTSAKVSATVPPQASVAVGVAKEGVAGHSTVVGAGSELITGGVLSSTVMVWLAVLALPQGSVAVQVRFTEYACGQEPGVVTSAKVRVTFPPQASVAVGVVKEGVAGHSMVLGAGSELITGAVLSSTVIV